MAGSLGVDLPDRLGLTASSSGGRAHPLDVPPQGNPFVARRLGVDLPDRLLAPKTSFQEKDVFVIWLILAICRPRLLYEPFKRPLRNAPSTINPVRGGGGLW